MLDFALGDLTIPNVLGRVARDLPEKVFVREIATGTAYTYRDFDLWSERVANALTMHGVTKGEHIGVLMGNSAWHLAVFFGIGKRGAVSVPVNTAARGELLRYFLDHSDCETIIIDAALLDRLLEIVGRLPKLRIVFVVEIQGGSLLEPGIRPKILDFGSLVAAASPEGSVEDIRCWDLLMLAYTSGTTGPSKASMLSHAAALTYGTGAAEAQGYRESDVFYVCLPLFHNNALLAATGAALVVGGSVVLSERFSVSNFWSEIRNSGATITNFLGAMSNFLWTSPPSSSDSDNELRLVSMSPTPKYAAQFEQRFGLKVMTNYGLSDFGMGTSFTEHDPRGKLGSIGRPRRGMQMKIVDDTDFEVPDGTIGEIVLRCDDPWRATNGYYKMPEATLAAHRNQWFHTGDRGIRDSDGYFWFVDRKKDCIRRRGENISAFEVEQILATHPAVSAVAVFPVAADGNDEEVGAAVVKRAGASVDEIELIRHCEANMSYFMIPRYIEFRGELPVTVNQKVEKYRLREQFETDLSRAWDRDRAGVKLQR